MYNFIWLSCCSELIEQSGGGSGRPRSNTIHTTSPLKFKPLGWAYISKHSFIFSTFYWVLMEFLSRYSSCRTIGISKFYCTCHNSFNAETIRKVKTSYFLLKWRVPNFFFYLVLLWFNLIWIGPDIPELYYGTVRIRNTGFNKVPGGSVISINSRPSYNFLALEFVTTLFANLGRCLCVINSTLLHPRILLYWRWLGSNPRVFAERALVARYTR